MNENKRVLLALTLGIGAGILTATTHSAPLLALAGNVAPIGGLWVSAIRMTVIPLAAAASGAMMPLVVFTILFALAIVRARPESRAVLVAFFAAVADAMLVLVRWIILLAPIGVFALVFPLAAQAGAGLVGAIGFY